MAEGNQLLSSKPAGSPYVSGTMAGAGSFRCLDCDFPVALMALDEVPECPSCGSGRFRRASLFERPTAETEQVPAEAEPDWLSELREGIDQDGQYLAFQDDDRTTLIPVTKQWTRIGRSVTADIRFDDPTVSRRHALIIRQPHGIRILDDRSLNGVFVNGERVEWEALKDGDELFVGRYRLHFLDTSAVSADA